MPLFMIRNDITKMQVDAIVNPSNPELCMGRGTSGAIYSAAGEKKLTNACRKIGGCEVGKAVLTEGFAIGRIQKYLPEKERAEKVIFVIITDGLENSSREYSYKHLQEMIDHQKKKYNWEFIFLGANMDVVAEAKKFGISEDRAVTFENDSQGVQLNYRVVENTLATMRASAPMERVGAEWKQEIREDYAKRGKLKFWKKR